MREFLHVNVLGDACVFALEHWQPGPDELSFLNVGIGVDVRIRELAESVASATCGSGTVKWDLVKPDGTPKEQLDVSRMARLGWRAKIPFSEGSKSTVGLYRQQLSHSLLRF